MLDQNAGSWCTSFLQMRHQLVNGTEWTRQLALPHFFESLAQTGCDLFLFLDFRRRTCASRAGLLRYSPRMCPHSFPKIGINWCTGATFQSFYDFRTQMSHGTFPHNALQQLDLILKLVEALLYRYIAHSHMI